MYAVGLFARNQWIRTTGRQLIQALIYGGTLTMGMRYAIGRKRPYTSENDQYEFETFTSDGELQAFPSGHMVVAMTSSTILAEKIDTWWARAILYPFAMLTGYARMYNDKHWLSDIIFGTALGYGSAKFVLNQEERREKEELKKRTTKEKVRGSGLQIIPTGFGFSLTYGF
jgi:membrane-associated phospholipid phosphatase